MLIKEGALYNLNCLITELNCMIQSARPRGYEGVVLEIIRGEGYFTVFENRGVLKRGVCVGDLNCCIGFALGMKYVFISMMS